MVWLFDRLHLRCRSRRRTRLHFFVPGDPAVPVVRSGPGARNSPQPVSNSRLPTSSYLLSESFLYDLHRSYQKSYGSPATHGTKISMNGTAGGDVDWDTRRRPTRESTTRTREGNGGPPSAVYISAAPIDQITALRMHPDAPGLCTTAQPEYDSGIRSFNRVGGCLWTQPMITIRSLNR